MSVQLIFVILGPLFLVLGLREYMGAGRMVPRARAWLILGVCFTVIAGWLWWKLPPGTH